MWSKDWAVGNAYSRCPRARPAPFRRFVHMSTAWARGRADGSAGARRDPSEQRLASLVELLGGLHIGQCPRELL